MTPDSTYTGDVTLTGDEQTPVEITNPEDAYLRQQSVTGDVKIVNAEYVYTATPTDSTAEINTVETGISGDIEDAYTAPDAVTGDLIIEDAEDVFIAHDAVEGDLQIVGAEQRFSAGNTTPPQPPTDYDHAVTGWQQHREFSSPDLGFIVTGAQATVTATDVTNNITVYVTGYDNDIEIRGKRITAAIHVIGSGNTITTSPYVNPVVKTDTGTDNTVTAEAVPVEDLINTTQREAYKNAFFGRNKVTYQEPALDQPHCPSCGADADAIIEKHREDAWFLFGYPLYHFDAGSGVYKCDECSTTGLDDVSLTEEERKTLYQ